MPISRNTVERLSGLARLGIFPSDMENLSTELAQILDYMAMLETVNVDEIEAVSSLSGVSSRLRPDTVVTSMSVERALANASQSRGGYFLVPRVI